MKRILIYALLAIGLLIASGITFIKTALPNIPLREGLIVESTTEQIQRGSYLANSVAVCMDCHSQRDWSKFSGPPTPGTLGQGGERFDQQMGLPGAYFSRNLTPTFLGDWTDAEIFRAITSGVNKDGNALFPIMPHHNYGKTSEKDIKAIIAYLRSLAPKEYLPPSSSSDFPMNIIINTIPKEPEFMGYPDGSDQILKGKYLITMASCGDCHTPFDKGQYDMSKFLAGGRTFPLPGGTLTTPNLTPDMSTGLGSWTEDQFVKRFKAYADSSYVIPTVQPEDYNTIMPWIMYGTMEEEDLKAIFAYLNSLEPISHSVEKWVPRQEL